MEIDTGAALSIISYNTFKQHCPRIKLLTTGIRLKTYTGEVIVPKGKCEVKLSYGNVSTRSILYVFNEDLDPIFGRK